MPEEAQSPKTTADPSAQRSVREVDGIFFDRESLDHAVSALVAAGFSPSNMTAVLERQVDGGKRAPVSALPPAPPASTDRQQVRTLASTMAGAVGALAAAGVTIATGGAAMAAVAAAMLVGGSAISGVRVLKTLTGFGETTPEEDVILSVAVSGQTDEDRVLEIFQQHGAAQIWAQDRPY